MQCALELCVAFCVAFFPPAGEEDRIGVDEKTFYRG